MVRVGGIYRLKMQWISLMCYFSIMPTFECSEYYQTNGLKVLKERLTVISNIQI
jgi:hypothetical protein